MSLGQQHKHYFLIILIMLHCVFFSVRKSADVSLGPWKLTLDLPCFEPFMKYR